MAKAAAISFKEFRTRYQTEDSCREELFRQRFPEGFVCPKCGCKEFYSIRSRNICQCRSCRHQTSVTAGTMMHRTLLPLTVWFWAIYLCVTDKRGISAVQLNRTLEISSYSAWHLLERIRKAMGQRDEQYELSGIVEMDDCFIGGSSRNGKRGRGTGYQSYCGLENVVLHGSPYEVGDLHWLHTVISNFKASLLGTYHGRCVHLQSYMDEFCFRFNRRNTGNQLFLRLTSAVATSCVLLS